MAVPSLPFSLSDINTEFGSKSLATHFSDGDGGVGSLPGSMSEFAGLSGNVNPSSVSVAPNDTDHVTDTGASSGFSHVFTATPSPADTGTNGGYTYSWTRTSNTGNSSATMGSNGNPTLSVSATLFDGDTVTATYRCTVTGEDGSTQVSDTATLAWSYTDEGA